MPVRLWWYATFSDRGLWLPVWGSTLRHNSIKIGGGLDYGHHFESAAMNGPCFQEPIGFIKFSISSEFVPLLMDKDLLHKIFVSLRGIKQELYAKSFQIYVKTYLPTLKTHVANLKRDAKDLSCDLQRLEVRGKLESKTLYYLIPSQFVSKIQKIVHCQRTVREPLT